MLVIIYYYYILCINDFLTIKSSNLNLKKPTNSGIKIFFLVALQTAIYLNTLSGWNSICVANSVFLNSFFLTYFKYCILLLLLLLTISLDNVFKKNTFDCYFSIVLTVLTALQIFFFKNLLGILLIVEAVSILLLYQIVISNVYFNFNNTSKKHMYQKLVQAITYQFLINFLSAFFFTYFCILTINKVGSADLLFLKVIYKNVLSNILILDTFYLIIFYFFLVFFLMKVGLASAINLKIEIYKFLPLSVLLYYSLFYFFIFLFFFIVISYIYLPILVIKVKIPLIVFFLLNLFLVASNLFNIKNIKVFLVYSSILTISNILIFSLIIL